MNIGAHHVAPLAVLILWGLAPLGASDQQRPEPAAVSPALFPPSLPLPSAIPATAATVKLRASVTFRDDATAGMNDDLNESVELRSAFDLLPALRSSRPARGSSNLASEFRPFPKTAWDTARIGDRVRLYAVVKSGAGDPCSVETGLGAGPKGDVLALWEVDARVAAASHGPVGSGVVTLDLTWSRVHRIGGRSTVSDPERRTIMLKSGERHVIDFFAAPRGVSSRCANFVLDVSASVPLPPDAERTRLAWDVWLVHKDRAGREWRQRQYATVASGSPLTALFDGLGWVLSGSMAKDGSPDAPLRLEAVTTVRGLARPDGKINVVVHYTWFVGSSTWPPVPSADRTGERGGRADVSTASQDGRPRPVRAVTSGGARMLQMEHGQTVGFVVPLPNEDLSLEIPLSGVATPLGPGVTVTGRNATIDLEKFFAGTETSLILTVKRR